ncbi:MAG: hypothetical protein AVDCRST_MAG18-2213, partial [uncultured Thermomicrobiales bacterium]
GRTVHRRDRPRESARRDPRARPRHRARLLPRSGRPADLALDRGEGQPDHGLAARRATRAARGRARREPPRDPRSYRDRAERCRGGPQSPPSRRAHPRATAQQDPLPQRRSRGPDRLLPRPGRQPRRIPTVAV